MGAVFVGMINLVTIRDTSIMVAVVGALVVLSVIALRERSRIQREQHSSKSPSK